MTAFAGGQIMCGGEGRVHVRIWGEPHYICPEDLGMLLFVGDRVSLFKKGPAPQEDPQVSTRCRSGPVAESLPRWDGSGISARRMVGIPARCLSSGLRRVLMFENEMQTRCAICGTGLLLGLIFVLAHHPLILLTVPVAVLFLGIVADPEETHAVWYGMLNTLGIFDLSVLTESENVNYSQKKHYFWFGEVGMAGILAGSIAVPAGIFLAGRAEISLAFIGAAVLFLPLFVFMPKLIQHCMKADTEAAINAFGKNGQVKKVFWTLFVAMAGLVLARVMDPVTAQQVVGIITALGV